MTRARAARLWWLASSLAAWSCGDGAPGSVGERRALTVFAASSLTEAFREIAPRFEARRSDVDVVLVFAGSQVLRLQIEQGAEFQVFASADLAHVRALADAGLATTPRVFAANDLAVIVPPDNPARIESFGDLPRAERLVLGTAAVPVGAYARVALTRATAHYGAAFEAKVLERVVSHESNTRLVRTKVELGEADAAIVYRTDAVAAGASDAGTRVRAVPVPPSLGVRVEYAIAVAAGTADRSDAEAWVEFVLSPEGQGVLSRRGFAGPGLSPRDRP